MASASSLEKDATDTTNLLERSEVVERAPEEDHQEAEQDDQEETHNNEDPPTVEDGASRGTLSMSLGVVAPVCLSMFSTLLYLRIGYIVGNAGLAVALAMLVVAYAILAITVSSISAISTNGEVKGGGVYFMISRTLGESSFAAFEPKIP